MSVSKNFSILWAVASAPFGSRQRRNLCIGLLVLCLALIGSALSAWAQATSSGTVIGVVTDPSGAVVPKATVTITDVATNAKRTTKTNETGAYVFVNVRPGTYDVAFSQTGFAEARIPNQDVEVGKQLTLNVSLKVGAASQVIEVQVTGTELQTMNATIGNTITGTALQNLPALGRDVSTFATLQPGVSPDGSVAGTVVDQANFMLDGGNNSNDMDGSSGVYNPSFGDDPTGGLISNPNNQISGQNGFQPSGVMPTPADSVQEFKVATTNQTADFNNSSGMQVSIVTKSGTSAWHGTVYEYYLNNNFSANTWENKQTVPVTPQPDWHRNWFGAAAGGPLIPKKILGGETYIFANYQGSRWNNSETIAKLVPSADMRNGILHDPDNPSGPPIDLNTLDPRGIGINPLVKQMWDKYMPLPNQGCAGLSGTYCDGVNTLGYRANLGIPQNDNFGVVRLDHDFGPKWHFMASYRYYHLTRATHSQVDIGGFFPGDTLGVPASLSNRPQVPWYLVLGMTTAISPHVTNDFRYSFLRNWWQWGSAGDPAQFSQLAAAIEPFGESNRNIVLAPYNVNTQDTRTRIWNGKDHFLSDNVSMLKGSHLLQFGGQYQHNWNYHQRTDNGGGINYYPVYLLGDSGGSGNVDMIGLGATIANSTVLSRAAAAALGIVTDTQQAYTRTGADLALNPPLTPASDASTIDYYNFYFNDTWRVKPSLTLSYGISWTLEMPPVEAAGKQVELVDQAGQQIDIQAYMAQRQAAALKGLVYNPVVGYALVGNTAGGLKYPYNPFYGSFSPRIAVAWNPDLGERFGGKNTVFRGGYGRIYGRLNGVDLVLVPLLGTGLIQPVQCRFVLANGTCDASVTPTATTAFRIGIDGNSAPIPQASPTLPQPLFPGINDVSAAAGEAIDPHFRPNSVDSFVFSIQHQFSSKMSVEVGAISRWIHNEYQPININAVPYMMTLGGQQFAQAYAAVEKAMGCTTSVDACVATQKSAVRPTVAAQPFFEAALAGTGFCNGYANCTAAIVDKEFGNLATQSVWSLWSDLDNGGTAPGWNFPRSMLNSPLAGPFGANGQISGGVGVNASVGHGNYNAGFVSFKMNSWRGLTMQHNFTWSKALGTGSFVQATSEETVVDPFDLDKQYGPQVFDRKFVYTAFLVYQPPIYSGQQGFLGHVLGGWTFAPVFTAGSGAPLFCNLYSGGDSAGYSGAQEFGSGDGENFFTTANCLQTTRYTGGASVRILSDGTANMFADPAAVFAQVRPPILGIDNRTGGLGQFRGLPYWNLNLGIKKNFRVTERFSADASVTFTNVLNHNQLLDPVLDITAKPDWGAITTQGSTPRTMEFGIRVNF
jgi:hypothetical protein